MTAWVRAGAFVSILATACSSSTSPITTPPTDTVETPDTAYLPGESYFGANDYVEYIAGDLPIILGAPHGGDLEPLSLPDRTAARCGGSATVLADRNTREVALAVREELRDRFGGHAHVVINHLHRVKLDANRAIDEAACGNAAAERAWHEFQRFLDRSRGTVAQRHGRGWFIDLHGHGHEIQRLELGYLLEASDLGLDDETLSATDDYLEESSIQTLAAASDRAFAELLRGETSLGALYEAHGLPAVPSPSAPDPGGGPYFTGGYNTKRHTCGDEAATVGGQAGGVICGVQIEAHYTGVRDTEENRARFAEATAEVLGTYLPMHWQIEIAPASP
ncbi:MAG TPA: hypothetical protein VMM12_12705 [Longimicrobiales bacterium]|nr:hypothetical protein [Longimicrobiales bacterium]